MNNLYEWHILPGEEDLEEVYADREDEYPVVREFCYEDGSELAPSLVLCKAKSIENWSPSNYCEIFNSDKIVFDNVSCLGGAKLISNRAAKTLQRFFGNEVQMLPIRIRYSNSGAWERRKFFLVNPLRMVDCIDLKKTKSKKSRGARYANPNRKRLFLKEAEIPPKVRIFRIEYLHQIVVVNECCVNYIREAGFTGFSFVELNVL